MTFSMSNGQGWFGGKVENTITENQKNIKSLVGISFLKNPQDL